MRFVPGVLKVQALADDDPRQVGEYRLLRRLGEGGMGRVYLGRSPTGRMIAVKMVQAEMANAPGFRQRFAREVRASLAVSGPGTVPVIASDPDAPVPWLATAYVPGPSLDEAVHGHGPLPVPALWRLLSGLAGALGSVHACGLVHRDLKPANVLLSPAGPLLIDFGIARAAEDTALTRTGSTVGSPGYMSPEQAQGREVHGASDVFSLGVVLAFAATGRNPFGSGAAVNLGYRIVHEEPDLSDVPDDLMTVVRKCLAKEPGYRPSLEELGVCAGEHGADTAYWLPTSIASELARRSEQLLRLAATDRDTGPGHDRGRVPPRAVAAPSFEAVPPATAASSNADLPTAMVPPAPITPPATPDPPTAVAPPAAFGSRHGFTVPTRSGPPPPLQPPPSRPPAGEARVSTRMASADGPAELVRIAPWVRRSALGHPLLSLLGLLPMLALLVAGADLKAHAREHPATQQDNAWWQKLTHWAMDEDGWRVPLTVLLVVVLVGLQYFRARLERYPVPGTRTWTAVLGGFWLLWSVMVPLTWFWVMGVGDGAEEELVSEWFLTTVNGTWWVLLANMPAAPFMAVTAVIRLLRGLFGDVARPTSHQ
ncbi:serine/threonine-protein kinase [Streptomyces sp. NPDC001984]|uniref:serine/threonine-protein kinase n=1 Tax=Streptomyces sp. NPDC002619 TaxID=3364655 RepID=UPI003673A672